MKENLRVMIDNVLGIDEVGYGSWAGPLIICSLYFLKETDIVFPDSKSISEKKREYFYEKLKEIAKWRIETGSAEEINKKGLGVVYKEVLLRLVEDENKDIFIDGRTPKYLNKKVTGIIKGDSKISVIGAASIVAKVTRDGIMKNLAKAYPEYSFEKNKGYGTAKHIEAIGKYGLSDVHRSCYRLDKYL